MDTDPKSPPNLPSPTHRECPFCKELMRRDASVCPHCRRESPAWKHHGGRCWTRAETGEWRLFDEDTPGCTAQACGIRDVWGELERKGAVVLGVSPDSPKKHAKFREKYGLPFTLLSDEDHAVAEAYATWIEKRMYGKKYMGMERSTFVIDADGNVASIMRKVKPADHADDVLAALP